LLREFKKHLGLGDIEEQKEIVDEYFAGDYKVPYNFAHFVKEGIQKIIEFEMDLF